MLRAAIFKAEAIAALMPGRADEEAKREPGYLPALTSDEHGDIYSRFGTHIAHAYGIDAAERQKLAKAIVERCNWWGSRLTPSAIGAEGVRDEEPNNLTDWFTEEGEDATLWALPTQPTAQEG